jgi:hypothetical protein
LVNSASSRIWIKIEAEVRAFAFAFSASSRIRIELEAEFKASIVSGAFGAVLLKSRGLRF